MGLDRKICLEPAKIELVPEKLDWTLEKWIPYKNEIYAKEGEVKTKKIWP